MKREEKSHKTPFEQWIVDIRAALSEISCSQELKLKKAFFFSSQKLNNKLIFQQIHLEIEEFTTQYVSDVMDH